MKMKTFVISLLLLTLTSSCAVEQRSSLPPQPPPVTSALIEPPPITEKAPALVWNVRDDEVVWGTLNETVEAEKDAAVVAESTVIDDEPELESETRKEAESSPGIVVEIPASRPRRSSPENESGAAATGQTQTGGSESLNSLVEADLMSSPPSVMLPADTAEDKPAVAENGSSYGEISPATGRPKSVHVQGYYRKDGTYVRGHYRSAPRRRH